MQSLAERKKHGRSYLSQYIKVLNTLSRRKLEYLNEPPSTYRGFTLRMFWIIQNYPEDPFDETLVGSFWLF